MFRRFVKDSIAYSIANILSHLISLVLLPFFTRVLVSEDYGVQDLLQAFGTLMRFLIPLEISQALARFYTGELDDKKKRAYASTAFAFTGIVWILFFLVSVVLSKPLSLILLGSDVWTVATRVQMASLAANGIFFLAQLQSRYDFRPKDFFASSLTYLVASSLIAVTAVLWLRIGVAGIFWGQLGGAILGTIVAVGKGWRVLLGGIEKKVLREMLSFSLPLVPGSLGIFLLSYVDRIAIQFFLGLSEVGIYGVAARFASVMAVFATGIASALNPLIYRYHKDEGTGFQIERIFRVYLAFACIAIIGFSLLAWEIVSFFAAPAFRGATIVLPMIVSSTFISSLSMFAPGLMLAKKTNIVALITVLAALFAIVLNCISIPILGIVGAAIASIIAAFAKVFALSIMGKRHYLIPLRISNYIPALVLSVAAIIVNLFLLRIFPGEWFIIRLCVFFGLMAIIIFSLVRNEIMILYRRKCVSTNIEK